MRTCAKEVNLVVHRFRRYILCSKGRRLGVTPNVGQCKYALVRLAQPFFIPFKLGCAIWQRSFSNADSSVVGVVGVVGVNFKGGGGGRANL